MRVEVFGRDEKPPVAPELAAIAAGAPVPAADDATGANGGATKKPRTA